MGIMDNNIIKLEFDGSETALAALTQLINAGWNVIAEEKPFLILGRK
jgi:hypothetical protein